MEPSSVDGDQVERVLRGDADAIHRFFHEHYPSIYRYLLWLTGHPEMAEDLTQETFIRAWRALARFDRRMSLRPWLHRIAHREYLRVVRSRHALASLDDVAEAAEPHGTDWAEEVEVREVIRKLPREERAIVVLHYLHGYSSAEIARILQEPAGTVRYRLSMARERLQRELGEGDLAYLNERPVTMRQWAWLPLDQMYRLEMHLITNVARQRRPGTEDREIPTDRLRKEEEMDRREFLRHAAVGAAGLMLPEAEKEVVDSRLTQKVTLAFKGTALSDLCDHLAKQGDIRIQAGPSVADEKVTIFCEKLPLREVIRQLSRPFGYTWLRSGTPGEYRYELVQDLRSQLLEEELRNRDRNAALLALEHEIERYRPYLDLSPGEALAKAKTAPPEEKQRLEHYGRFAWGPVQLYFRLSPHELAALRSGQPLLFSPAPGKGENLLPPELALGVLQSQGDQRFVKTEQGYETGSPEGLPEGLPLMALPEAQPLLTLMMHQTDLGQLTLGGSVGYTMGTASRRVFAEWEEAAVAFHLGESSVCIVDKDFQLTSAGIAVGQRPTSDIPKNGAINARLARDSALQGRISAHPEPSHAREQASGQGAGTSSTGASGSASLPIDHQPEASGKITTADVLEALYRATRMPIIADFYTHLYPREAVSAQDQSLFDTLNQLADTMRLRWRKDGRWLQFRSVTFYHDRLKEVPNRCLSRWAAARRKHGLLTPDDLIEIAQLPDAQLDAMEMAAGARERWGLKEWDLARARHLRPHLRFFAGLTPEQRWTALRPEGLAFTRMSLPQQQQFLALVLGGRAGTVQLELEDLAHAALEVRYQVLGGRQWEAPEQPDGPPKLIPRPPVREDWRQRVLAAARRRDDQRPEAEIVAGLQPEPDLEFTYLVGTTRERPLRRWIHVSGGSSNIP